MSSLTKGLKFLEEKNYQKANENLLKAYIGKSTLRTNYALFLSYFHMKNYLEAYYLAQDYLNEYIQNNEMFELYIKSSIWAGQTLKMQMLLAKIEQYMTKEEVNYFSSKVKQLYSRYFKENSEEILKLRKKLRHLGAYSIFEQKKIYHKAFLLDKKMFEEDNNKNLYDIDVHLMLRISILEDLESLKVEDSKSYLTILNEVIKLVPKSLSGFKNTDVYKYYKEYFSNRSDFSDFIFKIHFLYPNFSRYEKILGKYPDWLSQFLKNKEELSNTTKNLIDKIDVNIKTFQE